MRKHEAERRALDPKDWRNRSAAERDTDQLISESSIISVAVRPAIIYHAASARFEALRGLVLGLKYERSARTAGLMTESRIFGYSPRIKLRRDYCCAARLTAEDRRADEILVAAACEISKLYRTGFPALYRKHMALTAEKVKPEYRLEGTPFTSGIINKNNPLKYHYDAGNFPKVSSAMVVFKSRVLGGRLACPELGLKFELPDTSVILFDGQSIMHGVTPIRRLAPDAYRYSVVFYSLRGLWQCLTPQGEISRYRATRDELERRRAGLK